ncbi:regulator of G-protein signaling 21-like [Salminus brasiliensis]|uniref:regulator of G-protein signaling 21-like n=1 Tax=Salminus brasiliensis TaxID=930266 RepID=UPI003B839627
MEVAAERAENAGGHQHRPEFTTHKRWRCRLHLLLKKPSVLTASAGKHFSRPTQGEVKQWGQSLEKLLAHHCGVTVFQMFSKSEFCEENVEFWLACEDFKKTKTSEKLAIKARNIYEEFIRKDSPKEVNLDFHTRERIGQRVQWPTSTCFDEAQRRIFYLMENNIYPRFLDSDVYHGLSARKGLWGSQKPVC